MPLAPSMRHRAETRVAAARERDAPGPSGHTSAAGSRSARASVGYGRVATARRRARDATAAK